jgi:S1-C subfamily serine protease
MLGRADKIELIDPTDVQHQRRLAAALVDVSQEDDLCLLKCDGLSVPPISLADRIPPRGSEVLLIGFPGGRGLGFGLKATRGTVTALPGDVPNIGGPKWFDFSRKLWSDSPSSRGASGGVLCDDRGNVVAIHSTDYGTGHDASHAKYCGLVPAPNAAAFIRHSLPKFTHPPLGGASLNWSDVEAKASPSVVQVVVGYRSVAMVMWGKPETSPLTRIARPAEADIYDDRFCSVCNGAVRVRCRAPGCPFSVREAAKDATNSGPAQRPDVPSKPAPSSVRRVCPACLGTGYVRCPYCSVGIDPLLR